MVQALENTALIIEAPQDAIRIHAPLDQLDRKLVARLDVASAVHHAHAALADSLQEFVAPEAAAQVGV
jgi:hypothetical protein